MPREIAAGKRIRVEFCEYRKTGRQYVPVKGTTFFIAAPSIAAFRRAYAVMLRELERGDWKHEEPGDDRAGDPDSGDPDSLAPAG